MPIPPFSLASPPAHVQAVSGAAYSSRARRRLASLLRLEYLELRAEHLDYVRCVISHHFDRERFLELELDTPQRPAPPNLQDARTNACPEAL